MKKQLDESQVHPLRANGVRINEVQRYRIRGSFLRSLLV